MGVHWRPSAARRRRWAAEARYWARCEKTAVMHVPPTFVRNAVKASLLAARRADWDGR